MVGSSPAPPADGDLGQLPASAVTEESDKNLETSENQPKGNDKSNSAPGSVTTHTRTIGIIYPSPDIKNIVDKTCQFVAKYGPEFEKRTITNNQGNPKLNFLCASDPYHAYYQHRLSEALAQNQASDKQQPLQPAESAPDSATAAAPADTLAKPDHSAQFRPVRKFLEPPEAD